MKMCETGVKVEFEKKAFEQIRQNASQILNSDDAPDATEYNKGNATSGLLASQGLLTNLNDYVSEYGWDKIITGSLADTGKYDEARRDGLRRLVRHRHRRGEVRSFAQQAIQSTSSTY
ncbi:extracellular solute-binding protein [Bifidobacterium longum]